MKNIRLGKFIVLIGLPLICLIIIIATNLNRTNKNLVDNNEYTNDTTIIPLDSVENKTFARFIDYNNDTQNLNLVTFKVIKVVPGEGCLGSETETCPLISFDKSINVSINKDSGAQFIVFKSTIRDGICVDENKYEFNDMSFGQFISSPCSYLDNEKYYLVEYDNNNKMKFTSYIFSIFY